MAGSTAPMVSRPNVNQRTRVVSTALGNVSISIETSVWGGSLLDVFEEIRLDYIAVAKHTIAETFEDPEKVTVIVDGRTNGDLDLATLNGTGILAYEAGSAGVEEMKKAFSAAMSHIVSFVPSFSKTAFFYQNFVILVNGIEQMPNWEQATSNINIQVFSKARYASPLEVIKDGGIMLAARNKAKAAGGELVHVSFTYRDPIKMGQIPAFSKRTGDQFKPLAVPVLEIGTAASGTSNYVGNVSRNLNRREAAQRLKRSPPQRNLIHRRIVSEDRWHNTLPKRPD